MIFQNCFKILQLIPFFPNPHRKPFTCMLTLFCEFFIPFILNWFDCFNSLNRNEFVCQIISILMITFVSRIPLHPRFNVISPLIFLNVLSHYDIQWFRAHIHPNESEYKQWENLRFLRIADLYLLEMYLDEMVHNFY